MKYYSRTPEELREHLEKQEARHERRLKKGRRFIVLNLIIVGAAFAILAVLNHAREVAPVTLPGKEFYWKGYSIQFFCNNSKCVLSSKTGSSAVPVSILKTEIEDETGIVREESQVFAPNCELILYDGAVPRGQKLYFSFLDADNTVLLRMRAYP